MNLKDTKIIFFGTPEFAVPSFEALVENASVVAVVTQSDKPVGRSKELVPSPIKIAAQDHGIPVLQPEKLKGDNSVTDQLVSLHPDLFVVVAYGKIIPQDILDIAPAINVHPSLLPELRGPSPIQTAILQGKTETGISIMLLDALMDHGPVIAQERTHIGSDETCAELENRLAYESAELLLETLDGYLSGDLVPAEQDHAKATLCSIINKEDGVIDWSRSALHIHNQIRALNPWPGTSTSWKNKKLKITKSKVLNTSASTAASDIGTIFIAETKELAVHCKTGSLIIESLQLEGKKELDAKEFIKGYPDFIGTTLGK